MVNARAAVAIVALAAVLVAAGCDKPGFEPDADGVARPQPLPVTTADQEAIDTLRALPFDAAKVDVVTQVLRRAKVGVYPDDASTGAEPVRLTTWQVRNLAVEAANGGGVSGATLNDLAGLPEGAPPMSYLLAAWVIRYPSPSAGFAARCWANSSGTTPTTSSFPSWC